MLHKVYGAGLLGPTLPIILRLPAAAELLFVSGVRRLILGLERPQSIQDQLNPVSGRWQRTQMFSFLWQAKHFTGVTFPFTFSALWQSMQVPAAAVGLWNTA